MGLTAGSYVYHWTTKTLELLKPGDFRDKAGYLGLEQQLPADAAVDLFFLADLKRIMERYGNRGYRAVQLEAGILGGRLYLAAYAQKLGCSGLTFYDDDVVSFFSPHARGKNAVFLVALGRSAVRSRKVTWSGRIRPGLVNEISQARIITGARLLCSRGGRMRPAPRDSFLKSSRP